MAYWFMIKFTFCIIKTRLGGVFCQSDVIKHAGYSRNTSVEVCVINRSSIKLPNFSYLLTLYLKVQFVDMSGFWKMVLKNCTPELDFTELEGLL